MHRVMGAALAACLTFAAPALHDDAERNKGAEHQNVATRKAG